MPYLTVVPSKSYHAEVTGALTEEEREAMQALSWDPHSEAVHTPLLWWSGLKAAEEIERSSGLWPSPGSEVALASSMESTLSRYGVRASPGSTLSPGTALLVAGEIARFSGAENHCVGSVVGGVAGQEGVKVITGIYTPIDNTYVFNGIAGVAGVVKG